MSLNVPSAVQQPNNFRVLGWVHVGRGLGTHDATASGLYLGLRGIGHFGHGRRMQDLQNGVQLQKDAFFYGLLHCEKQMWGHARQPFVIFRGILTIGMAFIWWPMHGGKSFTVEDVGRNSRRPVSNLKFAM